MFIDENVCFTTGYNVILCMIYDESILSQNYINILLNAKMTHLFRIIWEATSMNGAFISISVSNYNYEIIYYVWSTSWMISRFLIIVVG